MTQKEKELLLQDLCTRLPYGVKCYVPVENCTMELTGKRLNYLCFHKDIWGTDYSHELEIVIDPLNDANNGYIVKPYLRPLSSMTDEESAELSNIISKWFDRELFYLTEEPFLEYTLSKINYSISPLLFDWLNRKHFDYRGLIERSLAIEVTKENNPYI